MKPRRLVPIALALALPFGVVACGSSSSTDSSATATGSTAAPSGGDDLGEPTDLRGQAEVVVEAIDNAYQPRAIKVSPGTKIVWKNVGRNNHNVAPHDDGAFPFQQLDVGASATLTFDEPGTVLYYCTIHSGKDKGPQRGKIVVESGGPAGTVPATTAP
jgi:plastocyanin